MSLIKGIFFQVSILISFIYWRVEYLEWGRSLVKYSINGNIKVPDIKACSIRSMNSTEHICLCSCFLSQICFSFEHVSSLLVSMSLCFFASLFKLCSLWTCVPFLLHSPYIFLSEFCSKKLSCLTKKIYQIANSRGEKKQDVIFYIIGDSK